MNFEDLKDPEFQEKLKACNTPEDLYELAKKLLKAYPSRTKVVRGRTRTMRRTKKPIIAIVAIAMLVLSMLALAGCEKSEFGATENTEKLITIEAQNAGEGDFVLTGSLEVGDGEQISVKADLSKGAVKVEIAQAPGDQGVDELPDLDGEPIITANVSGTDGASGTVPAGWYMVKATCLEKASGTVKVEVEPADG